MSKHRRKAQRNGKEEYFSKLKVVLPNLREETSGILIVG
jgi:hypothetical protein